jgi:cardiolipin synthase
LNNQQSQKIRMSASRKRRMKYTFRNRVKLIRGGSEYFSLLPELINAAKFSVHLQFYIFNDDQTGRMIGDALINAARRNVRIYFIADGYASRGISKSYISKLREAGISFRFFEPLIRSNRFYFGRRMHKKVAVIDGKHALVGGINISDKYNDLPGKPAWMDYALYVQGEAAVQLFDHCNKLWRNSKIQTPELPGDIEEFMEAIPTADYCSVRVRVNDWVRRRNQIWRSYFELFNNSQRSIVIMCSYFLPGWDLRWRLGKAAKRGVRVQIILAGRSDVAVAKNAERYLYAWMLRNNIEIYEYQPRVLHAKIAVTDEHRVTVGSYNVNNISAHASMELNLDVRNKLFAQSVKNDLEEIIEKDCIKVTEDNYSASKGIGRKLLQFSSYLFIKIVLKLFTFYFRRDAESA